LCDFPGIRNLSGLNDLNSLNDLSGLNGLNSLISSKKLTEIDVSINPGTKMSYSGLLIWLGLTKIHYFIDFLAPFLLEAVEDRDVTFNQIKGSEVLCPLLKTPKPNLTCIFLSARTRYIISIPNGGPCILATE
jgi:hypothetical protein